MTVDQRRTMKPAFVLALIGLFILPAAAMAQDPSSVGNGLELRLWSLLAGVLVPLGGYLLNYLGPQTSEKIKGLLQVVLAAVAGAIVERVDLGSVGFDLVTLEYVITAVVAALGAHKLFWQPSTVSTAMGGGRNRGG
jgi:peptidoglycan/LPS O-acetylase OafA/YrhL